MQQEIKYPIVQLSPTITCFFLVTIPINNPFTNHFHPHRNKKSKKEQKGKLPTAIWYPNHPNSNGINSVISQLMVNSLRTQQTIASSVSVKAVIAVKSPTGWRTIQHHRTRLPQMELTLWSCCTHRVRRGSAKPAVVHGNCTRR